MNQYLIPANSKKSTLILGVFTEFDLVLFGTGLGLTLLLLLVLAPNNLLLAIIDLLPGLTCSFLVMPIPYYHNARVLIKELYRFFTRRQKYIWEGWCVKDEYSDKVH
jgi:hypothetical protein